MQNTFVWQGIKLKLRFCQNVKSRLNKKTIIVNNKKSSLSLRDKNMVKYVNKYFFKYLFLSSESHGAQRHSVSESWNPGFSEILNLFPHTNPEIVQLNGFRDHRKSAESNRNVSYRNQRPIRGTPPP